ncbi:hypothetical protein [Aquabacterium sp.]|uniref:hypothetical protein n=1 Tax=Aquabacterium sp. TaxID=1872578 RepID=UPI002C6DB882|nr:hypothetical protein [Aquabacterium sp.]HSW03672.1 hypothetical protein [Aquabacterium sp.]
MRQAFASLLMSGLCLLVAGCDQLGIESASAIAARKEADGKAIGGACRHAARAIEDCYVLNRKADRAAVYAGWREMNEYMRENKLEPVIPQIEAEHQVAAKAPDPSETSGEAKPGDKRGDKAGDKATDKPGDAAPRHKRQAP